MEKGNGQHFNFNTTFGEKGQQAKSGRGGGEGLNVTQICTWTNREEGVRKKRSGRYCKRYARHEERQIKGRKSIDTVSYQDVVVSASSG